MSRTRERGIHLQWYFLGRSHVPGPLATLRDLVAWYLRFNGYFTVPNFVVHAAHDRGRISGDLVGCHAEVDTLAVRLPYSHEMAGIRFPTHDALVSGAEGRFDIVVAEVKSGKTNSPNKTWQRQDGVKNVEYLLRFIGWQREEAQTKNVAAELHSKYRFEDSNLRLRYIIFSRKANRTWSQKGLQYITFADCVQFISNERGQCWARSGIGRRSMHDQWNRLIKNIFQIANNGNLDAREREEEIWKMLDGE